MSADAPHPDAPRREGIPARFAAAFGDWTPQAVVFDCDGLLLDTESVWQQTEDRVVVEVGAVLQDGDAEVLHGSTIEVAGELIARRSGRDEDEVLAALHREFERGLSAGIRTLPGAAQILALAGAKVPLGCASNAWLESLESKLSLGGLREYFTALKASDTVARPKPAPDMYLEAAQELGAEPSQVLALEDSRTGARAARDAGLRLLAVPAPGHPVPPADLALTSLTDPDLAAWIATW
ncbi:HAD family hydrolase [Brachybacterium saurashtrense]|uniref:HAD family phosphatase n=1 Tax=Brachybacterium saurashtrense TaxID=556288 RepID=A0A345YPX9_9MICO|nr:HAD family phosphatase [Brachybacterium saurashtrense]AXK45981.1 HAD family phosphatase [Brachybacterium saurashtrense]RRR23720.1 HAD family phosphatase [Brachybacterium saurashtrense]